MVEDPRGDSADEGSEPVRVHEPVLLQESLAAMDLSAGLTVVDGTVGAGGHASEFARAISPGGRLIGLDRDAEILEHAERTIRAVEQRSESLEVSLHHASYTEIGSVLDRFRVASCDRVFLDLGVSSLQLDKPERGFSFMHDAHLDMRMDAAPTGGPTAAEWLRRVREEELIRVLREYGDERYARRIAGAIVETRRRHRIERTQQLADIIVRAMPGPARRQRIHPATRTFQAIRIAVNDELGALERGLAAARDRLSVGGRLVVISFHSAEDRIVKRFVREQMDLPFRKPQVATAIEVDRNPRSRSARLRCGIRRAS